MGYQFYFTVSARKDIEKLDVIIQKRLESKLKQIASGDMIALYSKKLKDSHAGEYRIRIGDYRAVFEIQGKDIFIIRVRHRREVYRYK